MKPFETALCEFLLYQSQSLDHFGVEEEAISVIGTFHIQEDAATKDKILRFSRMNKGYHEKRFDQEMETFR